MADSQTMPRGALVLLAAEAMYAAVRNKPGVELWDEIEPVQDAYRRGAEAAIDVIECQGDPA